MNPISRATAEHYTWGESCDSWHLLKDADLSVIQEQMPPNGSEVRHFHHKAQQFFFVLSGEAVIEMNNKKIALRAGEGLHIPPGCHIRSGIFHGARLSFW
jgi:mannose-6-phosphate isomerase-like protein (cupin superfamily)